MTDKPLPSGVIALQPDAGRAYAMKTMRAVFKADGEETGNRYSISEWWLDPMQPGPGAHKHDANEDMFYVLEGTASILIGDDWIEAPKGSFVRIRRASCMTSRTARPRASACSTSSCPADSSR